MSYVEMYCDRCGSLFAGPRWEIESALSTHRAGCRPRPQPASKPNPILFVTAPVEYAATPEHRTKLRKLLPESISPLWLDTWLARNPLATMGDCCKAILHE